jgi:hypothetical protein
VIIQAAVLPIVTTELSDVPAAQVIYLTFRWPQVVVYPVVLDNARIGSARLSRSRTPEPLATPG